MLLTQDFSVVRNRRANEDWKRFLTYHDVGHSLSTSGEGPILWVYDKGELQKAVYSRGEGITTHGEAWPEYGGELDHFHGRYEPWTGKLSVVKPERMRLRDLPEVLLEELYRGFPGITEIKEY
jgi:hypothetical protein